MARTAKAKKAKTAKAAATGAIGAGYDYARTKIRGKDGVLRSSRGNGDAIAKAMLLHTANGGDIEAVVNANKLQDRMAAHRKKSPGLARMTLGVMLRAMVRNGTPVKIGKTTVEKLNQKVELPAVEKVARPVKKAA